MSLPITRRRRYMIGLSMICMVAGAAPASILAADDAAIEALRQEIEDLRQRVQRLEGKFASAEAAKPAHVAKPVEGGWRVERNWNLLVAGMERSGVVEILGEPENTRRVGKFDFWEYGKGEVKLYLGRLKSWRKP